MPTQFTGRVTLILSVILGAFWLLYPGAFKGNFKPDLKPGIDMVGGTSLLYEIKQPPGGWNDPHKRLSDAVMESLKKRVDPQGVRNLIWRPQGNERLEIQMPLSTASGEAKQKREEFAAAQQALESTNVRVLDVVNAVEELQGEARDARLKQLAMDSPQRQKLFADLSAAYNQMQAAKAQSDAAKQAEASNRYDELREQIARTNLAPQMLQDILDSKPESRDARLAEQKSRFVDFPSRLEAIAAFQDRYAEFSKVKGAIDDAGELKRLLRGSGVLEFHIVAMPPAFSAGEPPTISMEEYGSAVQRLQQDGPQMKSGDTLRWYQIDEPEQLERLAQPYHDKFYVLAFTSSDMSMVNRPGMPRWGLTSAGPETRDGQRLVKFRFDAQGAKLFGELTGRNIKKPLGIVLDEKLISAPTIQSQIHGEGTINGGGLGGFSAAEQRYLINTLNAGSLPAQLTEEPISERTVGPQLGADNLRAGMQACMFGLVVVAIFLIGYYYLAGVVAFIAVLINLLLILGVMAMFNATFTLPGVAGIVLAIGAAVDANVLIFERLREEQHRGLSIRMALRNSYDRAWSAILDSNMTTVITSAILYWLGTEEVKGFAITLLIGLVSSMFTALFVTKTIFGLLIEKAGVKNLSSLPLTFPKWDQLLQPKIDWIKKVPFFAVLSTVIIVVGCMAFFHYGWKGELLDIEFASGTSVQFELKEPVKIEEVRKLFPADNPKLPVPQIVSVGTDDRSYEVVTPSANSIEVRDEVLRSLGPDRLKVELPSTFAGVEQPADEVMDQLIIPVHRDRAEDIKRAADGFLPANWQSHRDGAAMVLKDIHPPLTPAQIRERIERQKLQPTPGQASVVSYRRYAVESPDGPNQPTNIAVVFVDDENLPFTGDAARWREDMVGPAWKLITEAINRPPNLQKVNNFNPQVAGDTQRDAIMALVLSILVIMAYIWLRFGNFKYGSATMIAMIHDTLLVLAALGLSHWIYHHVPAVAGALMLEPFRLNITVVAAVLTVMSYSMIDTIVVFDRVRENRGKFGVLNKQIINDSINQTMSRTLLTAGTNIVTLFFMYIFGGPGIHGFTFVLLFGILIGTYSSVVIAAPLLLLGKAEEEPAGAFDVGKKAAAAGQLQRT